MGPPAVLSTRFQSVQPTALVRVRVRVRVGLRVRVEVLEDVECEALGARPPRSEEVALGWG